MLTANNARRHGHRPSSPARPAHVNPRLAEYPILLADDVQNQMIGVVIVGNKLDNIS